MIDTIAVIVPQYTCSSLLSVCPASGPQNRKKSAKRAGRQAAAAAAAAAGDSTYEPRRKRSLGPVLRSRELRSYVESYMYLEVLITVTSSRS